MFERTEEGGITALGIFGSVVATYIAYGLYVIHNILEIVKLLEVKKMNWKLRKFIQLFLIVGCLIAIVASSMLALFKDWRLGLAMLPLIGIVLLVAKAISLFDN